MNTEHFKQRLEEELWTVEAELKTVGHRNPQNPGDWEATGGDIDKTATESDELADRMEEYNENRAINDELEVRFNNLKRALKKIEDGSYGSCDVCGELVEEARLEANPAARTCIAHKEEEKDLE